MLQRGKEAPPASWYKANAFRRVPLRNLNGEAIPLGNVMGSGKSVVVFLRHLG